MPMKVETFSPTFVVNKELLRERLSPIEFQVTQEKHTERPYTNKYCKSNERGIYLCKICDEEIFQSSTKYDAGSGWPSFYDVISKDKIVCRPDASGIGGNLLLIIKRPELIRTEVCCRKCASHLGHVFKDGPKPTGLRYCVNSCSLNFRAEESETDSSEEITQLIQHPATMGGCDGSTGLCSLKRRNNNNIIIREKTPST